MAGLAPAIRVFVLIRRKEDVEARDKRRHDGAMPSFKFQ